MKGQGLLQLRWRPYRFDLPRSLITSRGVLVQRRGWLLRLSAADGLCGWGEAAAPLLGGLDADLAEAVAAVPASLERGALELLLPQLPPALACGLGMALAQLDGLGSEGQGGWRSAPAAAWLLLWECSAGPATLSLGGLPRPTGTAGGSAAPAVAHKQDAGKQCIVTHLGLWPRRRAHLSSKQG